MTPAFTLETEPEIVLQHFRPLLMPVYEALEVAAPKAVEIVVDHGWQPSGWLNSHLVRAEVLKFLQERRFPIKIDDIPEALAMDRVAMEGLSTHYDGIQVKILKGAEIPKPSTKPRRYFYQHSAPDLWVGGSVPLIRSLIVLWDCDRDGGNLSLQLCCTKDANGRDMWMVPVPHPAAWMEPKLPLITPDDLDDIFDERNDEEANG